MSETPLHLHFHTVLLPVKDLARSQEWYEQKLGMTVVRRDGHYQAVSLISPNYNRITIWEWHEGEPLPGIVPGGSSCTFVSDDLESDRRALLARGVTVIEPDIVGEGYRYFWIDDPDGHRHCVIEFLPE